jgi:integrase/recombinase XerD
MNNKVIYKLGNHNDKDVIFISFPFTAELNTWVRSLVGIRWSKTHKSWYVFDNQSYRTQFGLPALPIVGKEALSHIHEVNRSAMEKYIETLQLKAYSLSTINTYRNEFGQLLQTLKSHAVDSLDAEKLRSYFLYCVNTLELSENTLHSRINAVKFYFEQVLGRDKIFIDIPRPKKPSILPKVISTRDIKKLFEVTTNLKHHVMLKLCYGASGKRNREPQNNGH